jgi:hypothetical protein
MYFLQLPRVSTVTNLLIDGQAWSQGKMREEEQPGKEKPEAFEGGVTAHFSCSVDNS